MPNHLLVEVVHHDFSFEPDRVLVFLHVAAQLPPRPLGVEFRVVFHGLDQPVIAVHRGVVLQHIDDEAFVYRLLHGVGMEGKVLGLVGFELWHTEGLQRFVLWGRRKGEVARVWAEASGTPSSGLILSLGGVVFLLRVFPALSQCPGHGR